MAVAVHIGSQLTSLDPFRAAFERVVELVHALRADGHDIQRLDLGGGLGILYRDEDVPALNAYAGMVKSITGNLGCHVTLEPGRALVGNAGILVSSVIFRKVGVRREFLIVDAAMNDLMRPALYDAWHRIEAVRPNGGQRTANVVGPVCETGDTFATGRHMDQVYCP